MGVVSVRARLWGGFGLIALIAVGTAVLGVLGLQQVHEQTARGTAPRS